LNYSRGCDKGDGVAGGGLPQETVMYFSLDMKLAPF
jgi:hypothetical protein